MEQEKENIENVNSEVANKPDVPKENPKVTLRELVDGTVLARFLIIDQLPFIIFSTFLIIFYIGNIYHAEKLDRKINETQNEVKELHAESIATATELMYISKQSEVAKLVQTKALELKESLQPPKRIILKD